MQQSTSFLRRTSASSGHAWGCTHGYIYIGAVGGPVAVGCPCRMVLLYNCCCSYMLSPGAIRRPSNSVLACHRRRYQHHRRAIVVCPRHHGARHAMHYISSMPLHPQTRAAEGDARDGKSSNKKLVTVKFLLPNCFCQFNERLRIVGSGANTGLWTADASPEEVCVSGGMTHTQPHHDKHTQHNQYTHTTSSLETIKKHIKTQSSPRMGS